MSGLLGSIIANTPDRVLMEIGWQHLQIARARLKASKGGTQEDPKPKRPILEIMYVHASGGNFQPVNHYLSIPITEELAQQWGLPMDDEDKQLMFNQQIKDWALANGLNPEIHGEIPIEAYAPDMADDVPVLIEGWKGLETAGLIKHEAYDGRKNAKVNSFRSLALAEEKAPAPATAATAG
jgi:hypothetical protein